MSKTNELFEEAREAVSKAVLARGLMDLHKKALEEEHDPQMKALLLVFDGIIMTAKQELGTEELDKTLEEAFDALSATVNNAMSEVLSEMRERWKP